MLFAKGYQRIYAYCRNCIPECSWSRRDSGLLFDENSGAENNVMKMIDDHKFDLIVNIPKNHGKRELTKWLSYPSWSIDHNILIDYNARLASAFIEAFCELKLSDIQIKSWQEYK